MYKITWAGGWSSPGNFGDMLAPKIFQYFNIPFEYSGSCEVISVGSIARYSKKNKNKNTLVLGSGIISRNDKLCEYAKWEFVRGPLTRNRVLECGGTCPEIYGDPGLLLPLMCNESKKKYDIGFVPHQVDFEMAKTKFSDMKIINLTTIDPFKTAQEITECRSIISSSLHGIICAHSYGIPAAWVRSFSSLKGDGVKFEDYFASVNLDFKQSTMDELNFSCPNINTSKIEEIFKSL